MNCINCGANLTEGDKFCPNCGTPVQRNNINNIEKNVEQGFQKESINPNGFQNNMNINNENNSQDNSTNMNYNNNNDMYTYQRQNQNQNIYQNNYQNPNNNYQNPNRYQVNNSRFGNGLNLAKIIVAIIVVVIAILVIVLLMSLFKRIYNGAKQVIVESEISNTINNLNTNIISGESNNTTNTSTISNTISSGGYTPRNRTSSYKVRCEGFNFYVPDDLIYYTDTDGSIMVSDTLGTWIIHFGVFQTPYQQIRQNKNSLATTMTEQYSDVRVNMAQIETVDGVEFITLEVSGYGDNFLMGYAELNSMYTLGFEIYTEDNDFDREKLKTLANLVSTSEYTGESSYLQKEEKIKMNDVIEAFKKTAEN